MKFQPGNNANPNGRPKGSGWAQKVYNLYTKDFFEIYSMAIQKAKEGDRHMLKLFVDLSFPSVMKAGMRQIKLDIDENNKDSLDLSKLQAKLLNLIENQDISIEEGLQLSTILKNYESTKKFEYAKEITETLKSLQTNQKD